MYNRFMFSYTEKQPKYNKNPEIVKTLENSTRQKKTLKRIALSGYRPTRQNQNNASVPLQGFRLTCWHEDKAVVSKQSSVNGLQLIMSKLMQTKDGLENGHHLLAVRVVQTVKLTRGAVVTVIGGEGSSTGTCVREEQRFARDATWDLWKERLTPLDEGFSSGSGFRCSSCNNHKANRSEILLESMMVQVNL